MYKRKWPAAPATNRLESLVLEDRLTRRVNLSHGDGCSFLMRLPAATMGW